MAASIHKGQMKINYIASFDGLRGIAVLLLMLVHGSYGFFGGGIPRVDLFYMMSGFLITYLLSNEFLSTGSIAIKKFYARRALRIIPALIVCLILSNILWGYTKLDDDSNPTIATISSLFFFNNLVFDDVLGNISHLWSLSVEEHFYLIWPVVTLFILFRLADTHRIIFLSVLLVGLEIFRIIAYLNQDQWRYGIFWIDPYGFTLCRIDCILIGALLFLLLYREKYDYGALKSGPYDNLLLFGLALIYLISALTLKLVDPRWLSGGFVVTNILCASTVLLAIRNPNHPILTHKALIWIGRRSYGIYLYHMPIFMYLERFRLHDNMTNLVVVTFFRFALSIAFAALSYQYIERPILDYKNRLKLKYNYK
jgi:peptidoglycan/LPS O-acetylase OafA/YrhL